MDYFYNIFVCIISATFSSYTFYLFFNSFGKTRLKKKSTMLLLSLIISAFSVTLYFTSPGILRTCLIFIYILLTSFAFNYKWYNHILLTLIFYAICSVIEFIVASVVSLIFDIDMSIANDSKILYFSGLLLSKILQFIIVIVIRVQKHKLLNQSKQHLLTLMLFPTSTIFIILLQYNFFINITTENQSILYGALFSYVLLIFSNIYVFYYIDHMQENIDKSLALENANKLIKQQSKQYSELLSYQKGILKIQHDHKNFISGVMFEMENGNYHEAQVKLKEKHAYLQEQSSGLNGNIVKNIIDIKSKGLSDKNIEITLEYKDLHKLAISSVDVAVLLGNALDNAIEAAEKVISENIKTISVYAHIKNDLAVFVIKNPTSNIVDVNNLVTTKDNKHSHGYGILSMQNIAKKYEGDVLLEWKDYEFTTRMLLTNTSK